MKNRFNSFMKKLKIIIKKPEMQILPGQLAFFMLLSLIPLVAIIAMVASQFSLSLENLLNDVSSSIPKDVTDLILSIIDVKNININVIIFYVTGFLLASNGPLSMITGSNLLYKIDNSDIVSSRIKSLIMTVVLVILFLFTLIVPIFGNQIVNFLVDVSPNNTIDNTVNLAYNILKYPLTLFIIYFFIKLLYTMAPDKKIKSKNTTKGAIITTVGWIIATEIYSFYISDIADYSVLYGNVANLIVLFTWIYLLSYIFVLGMEFNAASYDENE